MSNRWADERIRHRVVLSAGLIGGDTLALIIALLASHRIASSWSIWYAPPEFPPSLWLLIPVALAVFALGRLYVLDELLEGPIEYGRVINGCTLASLGLIVLGFWGKGLNAMAPSRTLIALVWMLSITMVGANRFAARRIVRFVRRRGYLVSRAIMVGLGGSGIAFARHFERMRHAGVKIVGFVDDFLPPGTPVLGDLKVLGPPSALPTVLAQTGAHEAIVVPTAMAWESFQELIRRVASLDGYTIRLAPGSGDLLATSLRPHQLGFVPMMTVERVRIVGLDRVLKFALDVGLALTGVLLAAPIVLFASAARRLRGERLFRPIRLLGREGVVFKTGVLNGTSVPERMERFLKRFGLARFPQLVSVLAGRMSIVGPRPIPASERGRHMPWLAGLLTVKPGLTGPWAVHPAGTLEAEMEQSLFYIRNYTIWFDLEVLARIVLRRLVVKRDAAKVRREEGTIGERVAVHR